MSNLDLALAVLIKARGEILGELANCGANGGVGRAANYAPQLVNLHNAINAIKQMMPVETEPKTDHMKAMREAKASKTQG